MSGRIVIHPLTKEAFAPFGDVFDAAGDPDKIINQGLCGRHHDLAQIELTGGRIGISVFNAQKRTLPLILDMVERHPDGSQAFIPMTNDPFLVIVAQDDNGTPRKPIAFRTATGQGINFHKNTWHGVLTPLSEPGLFTVVDRIAVTPEDGPNLEEFWFDTPYTVLDSE